MARATHIAAAFVAQILLAVAAIGQPVGTVADLDPAARCTSCTGEPTPRRNEPVRVGDTMATDDDGRLFINFEDRSVVKLLQNSELKVQSAQETPKGYRTECDLRGGRVHVYVRKTSTFTVETPAGKVLSQSTDFFVLYDPATETARVIGVEGEVEVFGVGRCEGRKVTVMAHQTTTVERGRCPATPWRIDDATLASYIDAGELIGNGVAQTIGLGDPLAEVPGEDQAPPMQPSSFTRYGVHEPGCTTPACLVKPPFVPPGNIIVQF